MAGLEAEREVPNQTETSAADSDPEPATSLSPPKVIPRWAMSPEEKPVQRQRKNLRNVLSRMEDAQSGPLSVLHRSVTERLKVKVWTRNYKHIRGICTGYIVAFDKHFNLAMADVDEVYRNPTLKLGTGALEHSGKRKKKKRRCKKKQTEGNTNDKRTAPGEATTDVMNNDACAKQLTADSKSQISTTQTIKCASEKGLNGFGDPMLDASEDSDVETSGDEVEEMTSLMGKLERLKCELADLSQDSEEQTPEVKVSRTESRTTCKTMKNRKDKDKSAERRKDERRCSRERTRSRSPGRDKGHRRSRSHSRGRRSRSRSGDKGGSRHHRSQSCSHEKRHRRSRSRSRDKSRRRSRSRSRDKSRRRSRPRSRDKSHRRSRSCSRETSHRRSRSRSRDKSHRRSRSRSREKTCRRSRSPSRDRSHYKRRSRTRSGSLEGCYHHYRASKSTKHSRSRSGSRERTYSAADRRRELLRQQHSRSRSGSKEKDRRSHSSRSGLYPDGEDNKGRSQKSSHSLYPEKGKSKTISAGDIRGQSRSSHSPTDRRRRERSPKGGRGHSKSSCSPHKDSRGHSRASRSPHPEGSRRDCDDKVKSMHERSCQGQTSGKGHPVEKKTESGKTEGTGEPATFLQRHVNQLFIRGDNVVMVALLALE